MTRLFPPDPVLIVDDEPMVVQSLTDSLRSNGITNVVGCSDSREVMSRLRAASVEVILLDLTMPFVTGRQLLDGIRDELPEIPVIIVTGANEVATAVECMRAGAFDYMVKAVEESRLVSGVRRAIEIRNLRREYKDLSAQLMQNRLRRPDAFAAILTRDPAMHSLFLLAESVARTSEPVLITGETGTGKNLLARAIHECSAREGAFVEVNVAGLDDTMFADTLFGHRKGAFTGAVEPRDGLVQKAAAGTLFLDEIGDLSVASQIKLLRLLDAREYYPLGSDLPRRTDARVVAATNRDLPALMAAGAFRRDLFFRLSTHALAIPPLRARKGDLGLLLDHFLEEASRELGRPKPSVPTELLALLHARSFEGNVRELRSLVFDAASRQAHGRLPLAGFKAAIGPAPALALAAERPPEQLLAFAQRLPTIRQAEQMLIEEALRRSRGNQSIAAALLGMSHQALNQRLKRGRAEGRAEGRPEPRSPGAPGASNAPGVSGP